MIAGLSSAALPYLRPASTSGSNATTTSDLQPEASTATDAATSSPGISVSQLKPLQGAKPISVADNPVLRDLMATNWLMTHGANATNRPSRTMHQNTYAQVKVDGKVVATLYNGGSSTMTNAAAAKIGKLEDPPGLSGPDLAQWRADNYAKLLGGTVEKASTAIRVAMDTASEQFCDL